MTTNLHKRDRVTERKRVGERVGEWVRKRVRERERGKERCIEVNPTAHE